MKRPFDLVAAILGLAVFAPFLLVAAIAIKIDSPGPVFFRQTRIGRRFDPFTLYKLRSMTHGTAAVSPLTVADDPRITRAGAVLRRLKFDEVPQLVNVIRGDMSIVGPRPESAEFIEAYPEEFAEILSVRPGLTDPASLKYANESEFLGEDVAAARTHYLEVVLPDKLRLSREYVATRSLWRDLVIIGRSLKFAVTGRASQVE